MVGSSATGCGGLYATYCCGPSVFSLITGMTAVLSSSEASAWLNPVWLCAGEYWGGTLPHVSRAAPLPPPSPTVSGAYGVPWPGWKPDPESSSAWPLMFEIGRPAPTGLPSISAVPGLE